MENESLVLNIQDYVLLGLKEMEHLRYFYSSAALVIYLTTILLCTLIVYVVWTEQSLHEPMYIFIGHQMGNIILCSSALLPKLVIDLLSGSSTISLAACLTQAFSIQSFSAVEIISFTIMAYDRYLAVGFPLRYNSLMSNQKVLLYLVSIWLLVLGTQLIGVMLVVRLRKCDNSIKNVYCETMSLTRLACASTVINDAYGTTMSMLFMIGPSLIVIYCYIQTFLTCLETSMKTNQKAIHTLVTHIIAFSIVIVSTLFVIFRYRYNSGSLSTVTHVVLSMSGLTISITLHPLIYGIRMESLKAKMTDTLKETVQKTFGKSK
ncbi:olfactory receptor 1500-like [Engystomops pustulosus]|uniref:olfactory receptor 1500-like n=1 Tax=Engystomops pustulosus TaxID=76066 RepID=UPI003AFB50EA